MQHVRLPLAVVNASGRLAWANRAGKALLWEGSIARLGSRGTLHLAGPNAVSGPLLNLIRKAARGQRGALHLAVKQSRRIPVDVLAVPLSAKAAAESSFDMALFPQPEPQALIAFIVVSQGAQDRDRILRKRLTQLGGLTATEAAVAVILARGDGVQAVSDSLGVKHETARTHVARVLHKTGLSRQAAVARFVENLAALDDTHG